MITVRSTINIAHQSVPEVIPVVQGDTGRSILFSLADFTIPTGATARYFITKPSGLAVYNDATIDGNTVLVDLTAQSLAEYGDCPGQVRISVGDTVVTSFEFILHVEPFRGIDAVESTTETNIFDKAVEDARDAIAEAAEEAEEYISQALDTTLTIPNKAADAKATGDAIWSIFPTETAQGNPASFDDGADNIPVKDLKVSIVPNQDLHGYDKPWAGGAGKNLYIGSPSFEGYSGLSSWTEETGTTYQGYETYSTTTSYAKAYKVVHLEAGTYTFSSMIGSGAHCECQVDLSIVYDDSTREFYSGAIYEHIGTSSTVTWDRLTQTFTMAKPGNVSIGIQNTSTDKLYISLYQLESGSTATEWTPYSNECPITGMTEVEVERTGKNLYQMQTTSQTYNGVTATVNSDGTIALSGTATGGNALISLIENSEEISALFNKGGTFSLSFSEGTYNFSTLNVSIEYKDASGGSSKYLAPGTPVTIPQGGVFVRSALWVSQGNTVQTLSHFAIQLEVGSSASTFEPYHTHQTVTTDLGRTVYGGTLDVTTGVLTVDKVMLSPSELQTLGNYGVDNKPLYYFDLDIYIKEYGNSGMNPAYKLLSNKYISITVPDQVNMPNNNIRTQNYNTGTANRIYIRDDRFASLEEANADLALHPLQIVAVLATPQTYTLTPQELLSVLGTNHISTDAESVEVEYRADIKLYIENLTKPEEDDLIANSAIEAGKFFMIGNRLFLSTASIANGATINPGTNCTELSLSDALNNLNS